MAIFRNILLAASLTIMVSACGDGSSGAGASTASGNEAGRAAGANPAGEGDASAAGAGSVPIGVYNCFGTYDIDTGKFSVTAPGRYMSRGGGTGTFEFDGSMLTMVDGPYAGIRYRKENAQWEFRMLKEDTGEDSPFVCPLNTSLDTGKPDSW
jgi:hypothetical protein